MKKFLKNNEKNTMSPETEAILKENNIDWHDKESVMRTAFFGELSQKLIIDFGWEQEYLEYKKNMLETILKTLVE